MLSSIWFAKVDVICSFICYKWVFISTRNLDLCSVHLRNIAVNPRTLFCVDLIYSGSINILTLLELAWQQSWEKRCSQHHPGAYHWAFITFPKLQWKELNSPLACERTCININYIPTLNTRWKCSVKQTTRRTDRETWLRKEHEEEHWSKVPFAFLFSRNKKQENALLQIVQKYCNSLKMRGCSAFQFMSGRHRKSFA